MISIIAALTKNRMIGKDNDFPWHLADDLKRFKELTTGHPIIMGKNSFDHLLHRTGGKLLPNRISIVVTRDRTFSFPGAIVAHSMKEAIDATDSDEVFIIGGGQIFTQSLDLADKLLLTQIHAELDGDTFFPEVDASKWKEVSREKHYKDEKNDYDFDFVTYERC